jgi:hypothetical protein
MGAMWRAVTTIRHLMNLCLRIPNFEKYVKGKALNFETTMLDKFRSDYLVEQAHRYHVPIPDKEEDWFQHPFANAK